MNDAAAVRKPRKKLSLKENYALLTRGLELSEPLLLPLGRGWFGQLALELLDLGVLRRGADRGVHLC